MSQEGEQPASLLPEVRQILPLVQLSSLMDVRRCDRGLIKAQAYAGAIPQLCQQRPLPSVALCRLDSSASSWTRTSSG